MEVVEGISDKPEWSGYGLGRLSLCGIVCKFKFERMLF